jgi:hypothetical protein
MVNIDVRFAGGCGSFGVVIRDSRGDFIYIVASINDFFFAYALKERLRIV